MTNQQPIDSRRFVHLLTILAMCMFVGSSRAQINERSIAPLGLELMWENSIGGAGLAQGANSLVVWPHSTDRREYVDVFVGNRLIERIDARRVDREALDKRILEGKSSGAVPVLGIEGAKAQADKLIKTYAVLGKKATTKVVSQPVTYVVGLASNGVVTAIDGETGELLWQSSVPRADLNIYGPGVSDDFVTVVNGNAFYAMDLKTGNMINTGRLAFTPAGSAASLEKRIIVPSTEGRLVGYNVDNPVIAPVILRAGVENRHGLAISADRQFMAWTSKNAMYLVHNENVPKLWSKVNLDEPLESKPIATPQGFLFTSIYGTVIHATTSRTGSYLWRVNLAMPTNRTPVSDGKHAFILSDDGRLVALDLKTGTQLWGSYVGHVDQILGVGKEHLYVQNDRGSLSRLRVSDGQVDGASPALVDVVIPNSITDRLFIATRDGHISCMREQGALQPTIFNPSKKTAEATKAGAGGPGAKPAAPPKTSNDDIFGAPSSAPVGASSDDPFGAP
ncbi:MAG: PQQ-binding-like beta-propeller repeat protein [Planctomycetota bacterium]